MLHYYGAKDSCSIPAQIILEMSGQPFENTYIDFEHDLPEGYLALNPTGQVPTLVENGEVFTQCVGITTYLADKNPQLNMTPALDSPQRGHYLKWMHFINSSIHETFLHFYYPHKFAETEQGQQEVLNMSKINLATNFAIADNWITEGPYCLGDKLQACDLYLATVITWHEDMDSLFSAHPKLKVLYDAVMSHEGIKKVFDEHGG